MRTVINRTMRLLPPLLLTATLNAASAEYCGSVTDSLAILFPKEGGYTQWTHLTIVAQYNFVEGDSVVFLVNDEPTQPDTLVPCGTEKYIAHVGIDLKTGVNSVRAMRIRGDSTVSDVETHVTFWHELLSGGTKPEVLQPVMFHTVNGESLCADCHELPDRAHAVDAFVTNKSCMPCHNRLLSRSKKHGPSQAGDCVQCHEQSGVESRFAAIDPVKNLCFSCHDDNTGGKFVHGPTSTGRCTICHEPHSTDNDYFLRKPVWDLCTTCHPEKATGAHVVAGFVFGSSHPTKGWPDPTQPGKDFSCASCHNPHSADNPRLWKYGVTRRGELCIVCHKK